MNTKIDLLNHTEWKVDHRESTGYSYIAYPYNHNGKLFYGWFGPIERHVAEWLFDAVKHKQSNK